MKDNNSVQQNANAESINSVADVATAISNKKFIAIDLHSDNAVICVKENAFDAKTQTVVGRIVSRKTCRFTHGSFEFFEYLERYCSHFEHEMIVESTYNWYFLADEAEKKGWNMRLADPSTVSANKIKAANDETDAKFLAERLRTNTVKTTPILTHDERARRDLVRLRGDLIQQRAGYYTMLINQFRNVLCQKINKSFITQLGNDFEQKGEAALQELFSTRSERLKIAHYLNSIAFLTKEIDAIEEQNKVDFEQDKTSMSTVTLLQSIKGCGPILGRCIAAELGDFSRFASAGNFKSYCRLAPTSKLSNGKSKGSGNAKNGNAYLSWALTELANLVVSFNPEAKKCYERLFNRYRLRVVAIRAVAAKLAVAIFHMLRDGAVFEIKRCFS